MSQQTCVELEVRYAETDQMGIVHHANYLVWFELARTRFCAEAGLPYPAIEAQGYLMIITRAQQNYRRSARYGDTVRVSCRLDWANKRGLQFIYQVTRDEQVLTSGHTHHLWVRQEIMSPCSLPAELQKRLYGAQN